MGGIAFFKLTIADFQTPLKKLVDVPVTCGKWMTPGEKPERNAPEGYENCSSYNSIHLAQTTDLTKVYSPAVYCDQQENPEPLPAKAKPNLNGQCIGLIRFNRGRKCSRLRIRVGQKKIVTSFIKMLKVRGRLKP